MDVLPRLQFHPLMSKLVTRRSYAMQTRRLTEDGVVFLNVGYEEDPPMGLVLDAADERNRGSIQLYHRVASQAGIEGRRVLEVGCGHGGGASYLSRYLRPASYTAMDLNAQGIEFGRRAHQVNGLRFEVGDAQALPFPDAAFDVVLNVESSHSYPDFPEFLREVHRVLVPGGDFLYTDLRNDNRVAEWEAQLAAGPLTEVSATGINAEVVRGLDLLWAGRENYDRFDRQVPALLRPMVRHFTGMPGSQLYRALQTGEIDYRVYHFVKD